MEKYLPCGVVFSHIVNQHTSGEKNILFQFFVWVDLNRGLDLNLQSSRWKNCTFIYVVVSFCLACWRCFFFTQIQFNITLWKDWLPTNQKAHLGCKIKPFCQLCLGFSVESGVSTHTNSWFWWFCCFWWKAMFPEKTSPVLPNTLQRIQSPGRLCLAWDLPLSYLTQFSCGWHIYVSPSLSITYWGLNFQLVLFRSTSGTLIHLSPQFCTPLSPMCCAADIVLCPCLPHR